MTLDLDLLLSRSFTYGLAGAVAAIVGALIAGSADGGAGLVVGWLMLGLGAMALQAAVVGFLVAGSTREKRPGDDGVVMPMSDEP